MEKSYDNLQRTKDEIRISEGSPNEVFFNVEPEIRAPVNASRSANEKKPRTNSHRAVRGSVC